MENQWIDEWRRGCKTSFEDDIVYPSKLFKLQK